MKKLNLFIAFVVIAVMLLTACSKQSAVETADLLSSTKPASSLAGNTENSTVSESTTVEEESTTAKNEPTTQKAMELSTTEKASTTAKQTTKKQSTTAKATTTKASTTSTTKRETTTQKPTTTQKVTTTKATTTEKAFDINYWVSFTKSYAKSVGLNLDKSAVDCWDNPINANPNCKYLERDIKCIINKYAKDDEITDVWIWAEQTGSNSYRIYIGYA